MGEIDILFDGPEAGPLLALAHGAGAPMDSPFMKNMARDLGKEGVRVARFEFPYMHARREGGARGAPDRRERRRNQLVVRLSRPAISAERCDQSERHHAGRRHLPSLPTGAPARVREAAGGRHPR